MNIKKFGKSILMVTLATTMALSTPMAAFAQGTVAVAETNNEVKEWEKFVGEVVSLFNKESRKELAEELNKFNGDNGDTETSRFEELYNCLEVKEKKIMKDKFGLDLELAKKAAKIIIGDKVLEETDIDANKAINKLTDNKGLIIKHLDNEGISVQSVNQKLVQVNLIKDIMITGDYSFLSYDGENFTVEPAENKTFEALVTVAEGYIKDEEIKSLVTPARIKEFIKKINEIASQHLKNNMKEIALTYNLLVDEEIGQKPVVPTPKPDTPSGGSVTSPADKESAEAEKDITTNLDELTKEDADVAKVTETILKDINKLNSAGAKKASDAIIKNMMDVIKNSTDANSKKAKDSTTKLVEALVSRVTTQKAEVKDGKATLSNSKVKEQLKDAEEMIAKLTKAAKENNIELTRTIKPTLSFDVDKDVKDVAVTIPESLWNAIDGKANVSIKTKGVELVLEHDTFAEKEYTINVKENDGVIDLTTDAKFVKPITVIFQAAGEINFPAVYQIIDGKDKLVGGVYNPETKTIAAALHHFSFYKVDAASPEAFEDINELTWEKKAIDELSSRGYLAGMPGNLYAPHESTTRAELAAMLTRVMPVAETTQSAITFTDLKEDAWYYTSIATAVEQGWLVGKDNNVFDPSAPVTRQEVASVLSRVLVQKGYLETSGDVEGVNVSDWAKDAVSLFLREIDVEQVTKLDMNSAATRAEVAVMIYNTLNK